MESINRREHSPRDLERVMDYCVEHYFRQPNYWRVEGRLFFSIFQATKFVEATGRTAGDCQAVAEDGRTPTPGRPAADALERHGGRSEIGRDPQGSGFLEYQPIQREYGGQSRPRPHRAVRGSHAGAPGSLAEDDGGVAAGERARGDDGLGRHAALRQDVPWPFPVAPTSGRHEYPYGPVVVGSTPERFEQLLRDAARHVERDPRQPFAVLINAWNEWTEGCFLLPEERTGTARLEAIKRTFGIKSR